MGGKLGFNVEIYSAGTLQCHLADATWFIDVKHGAASAKAYVRNNLNSPSPPQSRLRLRRLIGYLLRSGNP